jgi:hypothetical protein
MYNPLYLNTFGNVVKTIDPIGKDAAGLNTSIQRYLDNSSKWANLVWFFKE